MSLNNFTALLDEIASARKTEKDTIVQAIESGLSLSAGFKTGKDNLKAVFNSETGDFSIFQIKRVQEVVNDPEQEIDIVEAAKQNPAVESGDSMDVPFDYPDLGRLAARIVRRIMKKTMEEIATDHQGEEMELKKWKMVAAEVRGKNEYGDILCTVGERKGLLPRKEQLFREQAEIGDIAQAVVIDVIRKGNESVYVLSRTHPILLGALFRREVPEIGDGWIVIKGLARDTAGRAKVAVMSKKKEIDPVGACIGPGGERVGRVMKELSGEKIDIIRWSDKPDELIAAALTPAKVKSVICNLQKTEAVVEVEQDQKAIAVGKGGLNIRLAGRLTRWGIRIK